MWSYTYDLATREELHIESLCGRFCLVRDEVSTITEMAVWTLPRERHRLANREAVSWKIHIWDHPEGNHNIWT